MFLHFASSATLAFRGVLPFASQSFITSFLLQPSSPPRSAYAFAFHKAVVSTGDDLSMTTLVKVLRCQCCFLK